MKSQTFLTGKNSEKIHSEPPGHLYLRDSNSENRYKNENRLMDFKNILLQKQKANFNQT